MLSDCAAGTPTAEFDIPELVRPRGFMSSNCCGTVPSFVVHPLMNKIHNQLHDLTGWRLIDPTDAHLPGAFGLRGLA